MKKKYMRVGTVLSVFESPDTSGRFTVAILANVVGDEGREYWIHLTAEDVEAVANAHLDVVERRNAEPEPF